ncbi:MOSC domain-containing protein [Catellatospora sp. NPDC049133]|uniref:MOSC domain-containing protein n=1 Tax=Catellatospora sp. NPDC049133 TaxID=3155499 RepID=UPI0033E80898
MLHRDDLRFGQFGENFTVDGLPDDEVCIGDRYRVGAAVVEVTQPRVTCYRVGLRMNVTLGVVGSAAKQPTHPPSGPP